MATQKHTPGHLSAPKAAPATSLIGQCLGLVAAVEKKALEAPKKEAEDKTHHRCSSCKALKPVDEFYKRRTDAVVEGVGRVHKEGSILQPCRECQKERSRIQRKGEKHAKR